MNTGVPIFIDLQNESQLYEIHKFMIAAGAELANLPDSNESISSRIAFLFPGIERCFEVLTDVQVLEGVLNSLATLLITCSAEVELVVSFAETVSNITCKADKQLSQLHTLYNLFHALPEASAARPAVYTQLLTVASRGKLLDLVPHSLAQVKEWLGQWKCPVSQVQALYRALHSAALANADSDAASKIMIDLLSTYAESEAASEIARKDAEKCVISEISSPSTYTFDHILRLLPVRALDGSLTHQLLMIFFNGNLLDYQKFYADNTEFINSTGMNHAANEKKMRLLTFVSMSRLSSEISFAAIQDQLGFNEDELEPFIIEALRSSIVKAKIDQTNKRVLVSTATTRSFTMDDWKALRDRLQQWNGNLCQVRANVGSLVQ